NPGATRSTRTAVGTVVEIPGRGPFVRYPSWTACWADLAERPGDPTYAYAPTASLTTEQTIPHRAPATGGHTPEAYPQPVVASMESFLKEGKVSIQIPGLPVRVSHIPRGTPNRPGYPMTPQGIGVHETANRNVGANAEAHRRFTHQGGGPEQV